MSIIKTKKKKKRLRKKRNGRKGHRSPGGMGFSTAVPLLTVYIRTPHTVGLFSKPKNPSYREKEVLVGVSELCSVVQLLYIILLLPPSV